VLDLSDHVAPMRFPNQIRQSVVIPDAIQMGRLFPNLGLPTKRQQNQLVDLRLTSSQTWRRHSYLRVPVSIVRNLENPTRETPHTTVARVLHDSVD